MDKLFEHILKILPGEIIPTVLAMAAAFFLVYYYKGFRNYTDVLHHRAFWSAAVVILGAFLLYQIHKSRDPEPKVAETTKPILIVPEFEDDERGQFKAMFVQQMNSVLHNTSKQGDSIVTLSSFLADKTSARMTAERYKAVGVIYSPKIVRVGDKNYVCFTLLILDPETSKPYPPTSVELEEKILTDVTSTLTSASAVANAVGENPLLMRLEALERRVADLQAAVYETSALVSDPASAVSYEKRYAIVIGVNKHEERNLPRLQYAVSDARSMASLLNGYGFQTTLLIDKEATREAINRAIDEVRSKAGPDDLFILYFAGNSLVSSQLKIPGDDLLIMGTYNFSLSRPEANMTLQDVVNQVDVVKSRHKLIILDACHGTVGLKVKTASNNQTEAAKTAFQVFSGSQDNEFGVERSDLGGGAFTQTFINALTAASAKSSVGVPMSRLVADVTAQMARYDTHQSPKLVTIAGSGEIFWKQSPDIK